MRLIVAALTVIISAAPLGARAAPKPPAAPPAPQCDGILAAGDAGAAAAQRDDPVQAACKGELACTDVCARDDIRFHLIGKYAGGFVCSGRLEALVSLQQCKGGPGQTQLLQATAGGWKRVSTLSGKLLRPDACKVEHAAGRDIVLCRSSWRGVDGTNGVGVCAAYAVGPDMKVTCPVRLTSTAPVKLGDAHVLPDQTPQRATVSVALGKKALLLDVDQHGIRLSAESRKILKAHPLPGLTIEEE